MRPVTALSKEADNKGVLSQSYSKVRRPTFRNSPLAIPRIQAEKGFMCFSLPDKDFLKAGPAFKRATEQVSRRVRVVRALGIYVNKLGRCSSTEPCLALNKIHTNKNGF